MLTLARKKMTKEGANGNDTHIIILGAGLAGSACASGLSKVFDQNANFPAKITTIDCRESSILKYAGCRATVMGDKFAYRACIPNANLVEDGRGRVINQSISEIDTDAQKVRLDSGEELKWDILVCATGARNVSPCEPPLELKSVQEQVGFYSQVAREIQQATHITILGSGAVGTELAGEIKSFHPTKEVAILSPGSTLVDKCIRPPPKRFFNRVEKCAKKLGIKIFLEQRPVNLKLSDFQGRSYLSGTRSLMTDLGNEIRTDLILLCTGKRLNNLMYPQTWLNREGQIKVRPTLQIMGRGDVFAIGDINDVNETKQGYFAQKQGKVVAKNIECMILRKPNLKIYKSPSSTQILLPIGKDAGASYLGGIVFGSYFTSKVKGQHLFVKEHWSLYKMKKYLIKENTPNWLQEAESSYLQLNRSMNRTKNRQKDNDDDADNYENFMTAGEEGRLTINIDELSQRELEDSMLSYHPSPVREQPKNPMQQGFDLNMFGSLRSKLALPAQPPAVAALPPLPSGTPVVNLSTELGKSKKKRRKRKEKLSNATDFSSSDVSRVGRKGSKTATGKKTSLNVIQRGGTFSQVNQNPGN